MISQRKIVNVLLQEREGMEVVQIKPHFSTISRRGIITNHKFLIKIL